MFRLLAIIITLNCALPAQAAPIWVERKFTPQAELLDERFLRHDPASTLTVDHGAWDRFLAVYIVPGHEGINLVRYRGVSAADRSALSDYITMLAGIDVALLGKDEQLAYWINLYNVLTVRLIIESEPVQSIRDLDDPWGKPLVSVAGLALSLNNIEHNIIRPVYGDNRIHYAVNCAAMGCPDLVAKAYSGALLDQMLTAAARGYVNHPRGVTIKGRKITVSKIYGWYREDFGADEAAVLEHIRQYGDDDLRASLVGRTSIRKYKYDWALNIAPPERE